MRNFDESESVMGLDYEPPEDENDHPYDTVSAIIEFEQGTLGYEEIIELFQHLVDSGLAWRLQGSYGRMAIRLIEDGLVKH